MVVRVCFVMGIVEVLFLDNIVYWILYMKMGKFFNIVMVKCIIKVGLI